MVVHNCNRLIVITFQRLLVELELKSSPGNQGAGKRDRSSGLLVNRKFISSYNLDEPQDYLEKRLKIQNFFFISLKILGGGGGPAPPFLHP
jgi:hypothetical protein